MNKNSQNRQKTDKVYSYYGNQSKVTTEKKSKNKFSTIFLRVPLLLALVALFGLVIYVDSSPIVRLEDNNQSIRTVEEYRIISAQAMNSSIFNITKLTFNYDLVEDFIKKKCPEISYVDTSFNVVSRQPVVKLHFYVPVAIFQSGGKLWLIDEKGRIISELKSENKNLPLIVDEVGAVGEPGKMAISTSDIEFIIDLLKYSKQKGINIANITTPLIPRQLDIRAEGEGYYTKFNLNENVIEQLGTWIAARQTLANSNQVPTNYIDIRAADKVFWK